MSYAIISGVYQIKCAISGKCYVGSSGNVPRRWWEHRKRLSLGKHHSPYLQNAWSKHGGESFSFEMIEKVSDLSSLVDREQFWIDARDSYRSGYNGRPIANSPRGTKPSAETRAKVSAALRGRKLSAEHRAAISLRMKAIDTPRAIHSPEARAKAALKLRGRKMSEEHREKFHAGRKGMKLPPEWCAAISAAQRGMKRAPFSAEHCANISRARTGRHPTDLTRAKMSAAGKRRGAPKLTREQIDRAAATRRGVKRTPEQKARMAAGRLAARIARNEQTLAKT